MTRSTEPTRVSLEHWTSRAFGDRWSLIFEDKSIVTRGTELEARQAARECGWIVTGDQP